MERINFIYQRQLSLSVIFRAEVMYIVAGMLGFTELIAFLSIKIVVNGLARVKTEFVALTIC